MTNRSRGVSFRPVSFNNFDLSSEVVRGVQAMGFAEPTPIQLRAFPIILAGKDLIGTAQTGTGKTAAFALPILTILGHHGKFRCLVLEPTRELAAQVETAFRDYGRFTDLRADRLYTSLVRAMAMGKSTPGDIAKEVGRHSAADIFDPLNRIVELLTSGPAGVFSLRGRGTLIRGSHADVTIFDPQKRWTFDAAKSHSRSHNTPFGGAQLTGKVVATIVSGHIVYRSE